MYHYVDIFFKKLINKLNWLRKREKNIFILIMYWKEKYY